MKMLKELILLEAGKWIIKNAAGVEKKFSNDNSPAAIAWRNDTSNPKATAATRRKEDKEYWDQYKEPKPVKVDLQELYRAIMDILSGCFSEGDPYYDIGKYLESVGVTDHNLHRDLISKAMKTHGHGEEKKGVTAAMAEMWDDSAGDAISDAEHGHIDDNSPFYSVEDQMNISKMHADPKVQAELKAKMPKPKIVRNRNPWR